MPPLPEIARDKFLSLLQESKLLEPADYQAALAEAPDGLRAKAVAKFLVNRGILTRFQAQHLLAGHSGGFFLGQYRILEIIGRGGMGKVYKAQHTTMNRVVALKVLSADVTRTDRARELFRREVMATARLIHPNIATAFDANEVNGRAFLVLEYVAGPSLSALVRSGGVLSVGQACDFARQAANGLQLAHEIGMVHRDIKPSNLLIQPPMPQMASAGPILKIVDFGLASLPTADDEDSDGSDHFTVLGTPDYLSPEQANDIRNVDIRSDLYGLGCTLYFLLSGQVPFPGGNAMEKLARHMDEDAVPIDILRPLIHPGVAKIVHRLMKKKPDDRFQTPQELANELGRFAEVQPLIWPPINKKQPSTTDEDWPADDPAHPVAGINISGTISIAEFASAIQAGSRMTFQPDYLDTGTPLTRRMWLAGALGFAIGVVLIAAAVIWNR